MYVHDVSHKWKIWRGRMGRYSLAQRASAGCSIVSLKVCLNINVFIDNIHSNKHQN